MLSTELRFAVILGENYVGGNSKDELFFAKSWDLDPSTLWGNKRRVALDPARDRVLQLSTCTVPSDPACRFVVTCAYEGERKVLR